jgi:nitrate reductase gamma subunit
VLTAADVVLFARLLMVNPALWVGEWVFHASFLMVVLRHLRYFLNPVPAWVWWVQTPGTIAGYVLPLSLVYILIIRLFTKREKYASPANIFLLCLVLVISSLGVLMHALYKPNLVDVKLFAFGIMTLNPAAAPDSALFVMHFSLVLVLIPFLPTHIFTAPLVMMEARKREQALRLVMHEE